MDKGYSLRDRIWRIYEHIKFVFSSKKKKESISDAFRIALENAEVTLSEEKINDGGIIVPGYKPTPKEIEGARKIAFEISSGVKTRKKPLRNKLYSKKEVNYRTGSIEQNCGTCGSFLPPSSSERVAGTVSSESVCDKWNPVRNSEKRKYGNGQWGPRTEGCIRDLMKDPKMKKGTAIAICRNKYDDK